MKLRTDQQVVCEVQGRLFELAQTSGCDGLAFIELFMNSRVAADLDLIFNRNQWMGEEYLLEELQDETGGLPKGEKDCSPEMLYWCGYIYRYWHYYTGETSRDIYRIADAHTMSMCWPAYHTLDVEMAIDRLKEAAASPQTADLGLMQLDAILRV